MRNTQKEILKFLLLWLMFAIAANGQAQSDNYIFYYGEPFALYSKETGVSGFTLLFEDKKTEKYKLDKSLAKKFKSLWQYKGNEAPVKFAVEKFEFDPENDACTHEAKVVLKGIEPQGFFTSKPLKGRDGSKLHEATAKDKKRAEQMVTDFLKRDGYKSSAIAAILEKMTVSAVSLRAKENDSLIVQTDFEWRKKFISMLVILTPASDNQLIASFSEIHTSEMETESVNIRFSENIDLGDGQGDHILLERNRWENGKYILLLRPNNENAWKEEYSLNKGC